MNKLLTNIMAMWNARPPREQVLLSVFGAFLLVAAFETLLYQPLREHYTTANMRFVKAAEDYQWLQVQSAMVKNAQTTQGGELVRMSLDDKMKMFEKSLNDKKIIYTIKQFTEEDGKEVVEISIKEMNGKSLLRWIDQNINFGYLLYSVRMEVVRRDRVAAVVRFEP